MSPGTFRAVEGGYIELGQGGGYLVGDVPNIVIIDQMRGYTCFPDRGDTYLEGSLISSYTVRCGGRWASRLHGCVGMSTRGH